MFCQKEEINHVLGNHKGARDHLVSRFVFTMNEERESFVAFYNNNNNNNNNFINFYCAIINIIFQLRITI